MWLPWQPALGLAVACALLALGLSRLPPRTPRHRSLGSGAAATAPFVREASLVLVLYATWQLASRLSQTRVAGALDRGRWLWDAERVMGLPSELAWQRAVLPHPLLVQAANLYYAFAHVPTLLVFLVWLFARHRDRYPAIRTVLALVTGACLLVSLVPVAPPRLLPGLGFVDTAVTYGQSVYGPHGVAVADQLSAMPSVHVAWATLVAVGVVLASTSPWRWLVVAHPLVTAWVVVVTANHFWADGIVALLLLAAAAGAVVLWRRRALGAALAAPTPPGLPRPAADRESATR